MPGSNSWVNSGECVSRLTEGIFIIRALSVKILCESNEKRYQFLIFVRLSTQSSCQARGRNAKAELHEIRKAKFNISNTIVNIIYLILEQNKYFLF